MIALERKHYKKVTMKTVKESELRNCSQERQRNVDQRTPGEKSGEAVEMLIS